MKYSKRFTRSLLVSAVAMALPVTASAQLEEILVTATKRSESTQDIPMSVQTFSGDKMQAMAITELGDLATTIPNFSIGDGVTTNLVTMRGMGSGEDRSFEQSVSMFVDGIYMPRSRQTRTPFFDANRVEVLRGPQAVLFGLNSTAGAISIHSAVNNPGDAFEARITGEYETEYEGGKGTLIVGGSPMESLGLRLAVEGGESGDGYIDNDFIGEQGDTESTLVRLSAVWEANENLTVIAKYNYADYELHGQMAEATNRAAAALDNGDGDLDWRNSGIGELLPLLAPISQHELTKPGSEQEVNNFSLNLDYAWGEHTITGLFGYSDYDYSLSTDLDSVSFAGAGLPGLSLDAMSYEDYEQTSFELRLTSPGGETFDYVAGIYYQDSTLKSDQPNIQKLPPGVVLPSSDFYERGNNVFEQDATLWSGFASVTWNINDSFRLIGGGRYSDDDKDTKRSSICQHSFDDGVNWVPAGFNTGACARASDQGNNISSDNFMPELVAQYDWGEDTMVYAKYSESAKSGGAATGTSIPDGRLLYDDETAKGVELGFKTRFADGAAELNVVAFYTEFDDLQVKSSSFEGIEVITNVGNAGEATTQGLEMDGRWAASDWLTLGGALAYLDASYDDYKNAPCNQSGSTPANPSGEGCDASGEDLVFAPDWTGSIFADVTFPVTDALNLVGNVTMSYSDEYLTDGTLDPQLLQDSYTKYDASVGIEASSGQWNVSVIGKNLSDEEINMSGQPLGAGYDIAYIMPPRLVVVQATWRFGSF
jgi:outer membrane receptor protein involved in Fe transport